MVRNQNTDILRSRLLKTEEQIKSIVGNTNNGYIWNHDARHEYPKDPSLYYIDQFKLRPPNIIDYIEPCCGDCDYEFVDLSGAPDIVSVYIKRCKGLALKNRRMEKLELNIMDFPNVEFLVK